MTKGKIEATTGAIKDTNVKLLESLGELSALMTAAIRHSAPISNEEMTSILGVVNAAAGLTRSNQAQLQCILEDACAKGV